MCHGRVCVRGRVLVRALQEDCTLLLSKEVPVCRRMQVRPVCRRQDQVCLRHGSVRLQGRLLVHALPKDRLRLRRRCQQVHMSKEVPVCRRVQVRFLCGRQDQVRVSNLHVLVQRRLLLCTLQEVRLRLQLCRRMQVLSRLMFAGPAR